MDFKSLIKTARPHLKDNSINAYATSLKLLAGEETSLDFLYNTKDLLDRLEKYKHTTRKNYLNAAIVVLRGDDSAQGKKALEVYEKVRDQYNSEYSDHVRAHKKTPSQEKNWIEWPDYLEIVHKLGDAVSHLKGGSSEWSEEDMMNYQDYILTLFYSKYPLRNDLNHTKIITKKQYNNLTDAEKSQSNYLVKHTSNKYFLVLNEYKTSKKYGEKKIEIDEALLKPISRSSKYKWIQVDTSQYK